MRAFIYLILISFCFIGCNKNTNKKILDENLYNIIVDYQNKYPIPNNNTKNRIFVYKVYFWKDEKDTIIVLQRSAAGISKDDKGYGIYKYKKLHPTFVYDDYNLSNSFILKKIPNKSNDAYYWLKGATPESSPPVFTYVVKNKEFKLKEIDTVWNNWD